MVTAQPWWQGQDCKPVSSIRIKPAPLAWRLNVARPRCGLRTVAEFDLFALRRKAPCYRW